MWRTKVSTSLTEAAKLGTVAALAGREPVAARIPAEHGGVGQIELIDDVLKTAGMFMAAVEQHHGAPGLCPGGDRPMPVEQLDAIVGGESELFSVAHVRR